MTATPLGSRIIPTAGTRLEIPLELRETFKLLARFRTRLRARHGLGTKRHIEFDDYLGSLFINIKLPGDESWTRVSPSMARNDLEQSIREKELINQKRLAAKLLPGPRERLNRPLPPPRSSRTRPVQESETPDGNHGRPPCQEAEMEGACGIRGILMRVESGRGGKKVLQQQQQHLPTGWSHRRR